MGQLTRGMVSSGGTGAQETSYHHVWSKVPWQQLGPDSLPPAEGSGGSRCTSVQPTSCAKKKTLGLFTYPSPAAGSQNRKKESRMAVAKRQGKGQTLENRTKEGPRTIIDVRGVCNFLGSVLSQQNFEVTDGPVLQLRFI